MISTLSMRGQPCRPAICLPAIAMRGAGLTSSASNEPRSRSPAVESVAIAIAPVNAEIITNSGMKPRIFAARCCALDTSTSSMCTARGDDRD